MYPDQELNPHPFGAWDDAPTEPHGAVVGRHLFNSYHDPVRYMLTSPFAVEKTDPRSPMTWEKVQLLVVVESEFKLRQPITKNQH